MESEKIQMRRKAIPHISFIKHRRILTIIPKVSRGYNTCQMAEALLSIWFLVALRGNRVHHARLPLIASELTIR